MATRWTEPVPCPYGVPRVVVVRPACPAVPRPPLWLVALLARRAGR